MYLDKLNLEEKYKFLDLAHYMVNVDDTKTLSEDDVLSTYKRELGELGDYKAGSMESAIDFIAESSKIVRRIVLMNLIKISLEDDFYHSEEHLFIEDILSKWDISNKKKAELVKLVYQEKDLREKVKIAVSQQ